MVKISELRRKFLARVLKKRPVGVKFTRLGKGWNAKGKRGLL